MQALAGIECASPRAADHLFCKQRKRGKLRAFYE